MARASQEPAPAELTRDFKLAHFLLGEGRIVHDGKTGYYDARIIAERGEGEGRQVKVHYNGYKKSNDEWLDATSERILKRRAQPSPPTIGAPQRVD